MSTAMNFNDAGPQFTNELISDKTLARVRMTIKRTLQGNILTDSESSNAQYLNCEFVVMEGEFAKRKFWENITVSGGQVNDKGQSKAGEISRAKLRAILESARNVMPDDVSPVAVAKRHADYKDFDGMEFAVRIGIQPERHDKTTGQVYKAKNVLAAVITPDKPEYAQVMNGSAVFTNNQQSSTVPSASYAAPQTAAQYAQSGLPAWAGNQAR